MKKLWLAVVIVLLLFCCGHNVVLAQGDVYYIATTGSDDSGDGSEGNPWATIGYALTQVPDESTILVQPGTYTGRVRLRGTFEQGVVVRSATPYQARLRNNDTVVSCFYGQGITLEGFDIAHSGSGAGALVIQIQDLIEGSDTVSRITLRNNLLHDSYNNDILKINNGAADVLVEGNVFYNQAGTDEHIDINSVTNVTIQDNIFFNDFEGSGRDNNNSTSSYIVIKDSNEDSDGIEGSEHIVVRRNVFLNWQGSTGQGYVRAGEDSVNFFAAKDVLIENNLMLGNSANQIRSPFQVMGVYSVTIRANTVIGDLPAKEYGVRIFTITPNPNNDQIHLHNNIWADPTGTMGDTFNRGANTDLLTFDNNLFWNAGQAFPTTSESIIEVTDDAHRVVGDPLLGDQTGIQLPRWNEGAGQFGDGSVTIRQAFERLVTLYGVPADGSAALDVADPDNAPTEDILGQARPGGSGSDIGAYEVQQTTVETFTLAILPEFRLVNGEGMLTYTVSVLPISWPYTITLATADPAPGVISTILPQVITADQTAILSVDLQGTALPVAQWFTVPVTATSNSLVRSTYARFFTSAFKMYLPLLMRDWVDAVDVPGNSPQIAGCDIFPADNIWNVPVDSLPVDSNSDAYIATIGADSHIHADFGSGTWDGASIGIPYVDVAGTQTKVNVDFDYDDESDPGPYPIPSDAPIEGGPDSDGDRHILMVDRDNCILYELYAAYPPSGGSNWTAGSGAIFDLKSNALRPDGWTSADAAGLPILPGLVRYDEVASGEIKHALRFTVPQTRNQYVWPARHYASSLTGSQYPPMGQRFRLKAGFDTSGFSKDAQVILEALKTYGMILADNGSAWYISGAPDEGWDNDVLHELDVVVGSDFEAVNVSSLLVDADSGQTQP